jgi:uncharacterized protein YgiM (DUF1202 family)
MKKSTILLGAMGMVALSGITMEANACDLDNTEFTVKASALNVRTEPNTTTGQVVKKLSQGAKVTVSELSSDRAWAKIGEGQWVAFQYLTMVDNCTIPVSGDEYKSIDGTFYTVTASSLNMREMPSTNSSVVTTISAGRSVYATKEHKNWLFVEDGHYEGWISKDYVKKATDSNDDNYLSPMTEGTKINAKTLEVTANSLNIRKGPGTSYAVSGGLKKGQVVVANEVSGDWYKVDGGWINKNYVKESVGSMNASSDELLDVAPGDTDPTRVVNVSQGSNLLVRYTKALGGSVKDRLPRGTKVSVINESNGVAYIKYTNSKGSLQFGYVSAQYLNTVN